MKTVRLFGYSDDNIEIRGDLGDDEFGAYSPKYLHFDDGTVIRGGFCTEKNKGWTFEVVKLGDGATVMLAEPMLEDGKHFSDVLEVSGNFTSVLCTENADGMGRDELQDFFSDLRVGGYAIETLRAAHRLLTAK